MNVKWLMIDYSNPKNKILLYLNSGMSAENIVSDYTAQKVSGDFVNSGIKLILNNPKTKIFVTALHIPDRNTGKIHHFKIDFYKFKRQNKETGWEFVQIDSIDGGADPNAINKLHEFIVEQSKVADLPLSDYSQYDVIKSSGKISAKDLEEYINQATNEDTVLIQKSVLEKVKQSRASDENIKRYENDLEEFNGLVANDKTSETDMQKFLSEHVWFFGLNYIQAHLRCKPKFSSGLGSEYDFLLEGFNHVYDIAELKGPNDYLIDLRSSSPRSGSFDPRNDYKYSSTFGRALHQVISYMYEFEDLFRHIKESQPSIKDFRYPCAVIVISKRSLFPIEGKNSDKYLHLLNRQFSNIEILTYDDLADRAQNILDFMKKENSTKEEVK